MKAEAFVEQLRDAMPDQGTLEEYGLDEHEVSEIQSTFLANRRTTLGENPTNEEALKLVSEFDCSTVEVGLVRFESQPKQHQYGLAFAVCEADSIVLRGDGTIAMYDHAAPESPPIECAGDSEHFLDGLAQLLKVRKEKSLWKGRAAEAAEICANTTGGAQYQAFFRLLCGFLQ